MRRSPPARAASLPILSVALVKDAQLLGATALEGRSSRNEKLLPAIDSLLSELEVLNLLSDGITNKEIASRLGITEHTIKFHVNAILGKLGAETRTEAVVHAAKLGIVTL